MSQLQQNINVTKSLMDHLKDDSNFYFGLILAITSSLFIGSSFIIKKKALLRLKRKGYLRAGAGGYGYLQDWIWWTGLLCMGVGELLNFTAYAFAPVSLVTPLGALSVLVSAVLSSIHLKEDLNVLGKLGCFLCILGTTIIIIHSPANDSQENIVAVMEQMQHFPLLLYIFIVIVTSLSIIFYFGPNYGNTNLIYYIILCSSVGSLTVMFCKSLGLVIREILIVGGDYHWLPYILLTLIFICISIQMTFLNRALDLFNTSIVTPVYYVCFTLFVLIACSLLFGEWKRLSATDTIGSICGFLVTVTAVVLLNAFKNFDINVADIKGIFKPKKELISPYFQTFNTY